MTDPVVALDGEKLLCAPHAPTPRAPAASPHAASYSAGKSYERKAIEAYWTREKAAVSPVTRKPLQSKTLVPNINLRVLCEEYSARQRRLHGGATSPQDVVMGALLPPPHAPGAKRRRPAELEHDEGVAAGAKRKLRLASGDGSPPPV